MKTLPAAVLLLLLTGLKMNSQVSDTIKKENFSFDMQAISINQYKPGFKTDYTGQYGLLTREEARKSVTATLFARARLWKNATIFVNPEPVGGTGLSKVLGLADATNGETFRISSIQSKIDMARSYIQQLFALNITDQTQESDQNQLGDPVLQNYIGITAGKICLSDYFDQNSYSHYPRFQFMDRGLIVTGACDYPAKHKTGTV